MKKPYSHLITRFTLSMILSICLASFSFAAQEGSKPSKKVLLEKTVELPSKNIDAKVRHVKFPVGYKTPEHTHKGPGPRYVLKGKVEITEGGEIQTFSSGEVFWESGIPMTAENVGNEEAELIIFELLPRE